MRKWAALLADLSVYAPVAQWIEHPPPKGRVTRSIRVGGTNIISILGIKSDALTRDSVFVVLSRLLSYLRF